MGMVGGLATPATGGEISGVASGGVTWSCTSRRCRRRLLLRSCGKVCVQRGHWRRRAGAGGRRRDPTGLSGFCSRWFRACRPAAVDSGWSGAGVRVAILATVGLEVGGRPRYLRAGRPFFLLADLLIRSSVLGCRSSEPAVDSS